MKTLININPITDNYLDRGFQNVLLPFRCFQHVVFLSCFSIKYNCVRPHRASYFIVSLIAILGFMAFHINGLFSKDNDNIDNSYMIFLTKIHVFLSVFPFGFFYVLNIIQRKDNVRLILKIQKAFRLINFKQYKKAFYRNWFAIFRYSVGFIACTAATCDLMLAIYLYTMLFFDVVITYGVSIIALVRDGFVSWMAEVEYYCKMCLEIEEEVYDDKIKNLLEAYIYLMEAFDIFKNIFKFTVRSDFYKCE